MQEFSLQYGTNGLWYGVFSHFAKLSIKHGISTRLCGSSDSPFKSLNLALHTGDENRKVLANRRRFCEAVGVNAASIVTAEQVHEDKVAVVTVADSGKGAEIYAESLLGMDALITNVPNVPLMLFFADCVPVLMADPVHRVVGISHAGWKGTVAKIAQKTVLAMQEQFGTRPGDCLVGIAPSIGPCCYEIDDTVLARLKENFMQWEKLITPCEKKWRFDLWAANEQQLLEIGVAKENIVTSGVCTACNNELFFSYRAERGVTGRIGAVITL